MAAQRNQPPFQDGYWWSNDGLRLHYRDYPGGGDGLPVLLCLPGLTRNVRDFEGLADALAGEYRLVVAEFRGRGESAQAKDPMTYVPFVYLQDVERLTEELNLRRFVAVGTSLGGVVTMLMAATGRDEMAGAILNDVGPEISAAGLARIRAYVGKSANFPTWMHAARSLAEANATIYPDYTIEDWLRMAKRLHRLTPQGRIVLDYDMKIAEPFRFPGNEAGPDMWKAFDALASMPLLLVRGETSDILEADVAERMSARHSDCTLRTIPRTGHAPTFDEPEAIAGVRDFLQRLREARPAA